MSIPSQAAQCPHWPWSWNGRVSHQGRPISPRVPWHTPRFVLISGRHRLLLRDPVDYSGADEDCVEVVSFIRVRFPGYNPRLRNNLPSILQSMRQSQALSPLYATDTPRFLSMLADLLLGI